MSKDPATLLHDPSWYDDVEWDELEMSPAQIAQAALERIGNRLEGAQRADARNAADRFEAVEWFRQEWETSSIDLAASAHLSSRALRAELAARMVVSERTMESLMGYARILVNDLHDTLAALRRGDLTERHARIIADEAAGLGDDDLARFEAEVLSVAGGMTIPKFTRHARTTRELIQSRTIDERHREARAFREVLVVPGRDGMGWLTGHLPNEVLAAVSSKLTKAAAAVDDPERTTAQIRADVFVDILLDDGALLAPVDGDTALRVPTMHRGIRPDVHVTAPVMTLLGKDTTPSTLDGYGPISTETAKRLVGTATSWFRILTHPETGVHLSYGRTRYEVPADLKQYLRARDETCRFIGCTRAAAACEIDHTRAWSDGGETAAANLACLCKGHHTLKHNTAWQISQAGNGDIDCTSPTVRKYRTSPPRQVGSGTRAQTAWFTPDDSTDPPPF